jgi:hypothetical protein
MIAGRRKFDLMRRWWTGNGLSDTLRVPVRGSGVLSGTSRLQFRSIYVCVAVLILRIWRILLCPSIIFVWSEPILKNFCKKNRTIVKNEHSLNIDSYENKWVPKSLRSQIPSPQLYLVYFHLTWISKVKRFWRGN